MTGHSIRMLVDGTWSLPKVCKGYSAAVFNQDLGMWSVSKAIHLGETFKNAAEFNRDISRLEKRVNDPDK